MKNFLTFLQEERKKNLGGKIKSKVYNISVNFNEANQAKSDFSIIHF